MWQSGVVKITTWSVSSLYWNMLLDTVYVMMINTRRRDRNISIKLVNKEAIFIIIKYIEAVILFGGAESPNPPRLVSLVPVLIFILGTGEMILMIREDEASRPEDVEYTQGVCFAA